MYPIVCECSVRLALHYQLGTHTSLRPGQIVRLTEGENLEATERVGRQAQGSSFHQDLSLSWFLRPEFYQASK